MLTIVGHKFGAPKGVAALYIRKGVQLGNFFFGGGQVCSALDTFPRQQAKAVSPKSRAC